MGRSGTDKKTLLFIFTLMVSLLLLAVFWFAEIIMLSAANDEGAVSGEETASENRDDPGAPDLKNVAVSHSSGFYESGILLEMYPPEGCDVLYTVTLSTSRSLTDGRYAETGEPYMYMGGKNPDPSNLDTETRDSYSLGLFNSADGRLKTYKYDGIALDLYNPTDFTAIVITVKAAIFRGSVQLSPVNNFTYILGSMKGDKSFEDIFGSMLISITIDDELLYDYETGIFINGKYYDEAVAAGKPLDPWTPKNYNQRGADWERLAHIDFFESDGTLVLSQVCGIRVAGGTSRGAAVKSLKLVADSKYGQDRFNYKFFEGARNCLGEPIESFKKLVLRNPRNDLGGTMIRDQLVHKLGGYVDVDYQEGRNAVVFLNGKYYSIMCLHESLDADFMEDHYFVNKDNVASFLIRSDQYQFRYKQESGTAEQFKCFLSDMNYLIFNDFSDEEGMARIREVIDVENFCRYMAFQIFVVNEDWPHNNVLAWRYYGPENSSIKGMDGRWRFVLKDLDFGLVDPTRETFGMCLNDGLYGGEPCIGTVLRNLIKNKEFRTIFRENCFYVAETLSAEYLTEQIDKAIEDIWQDMGLYAMYNGMSVEGWLRYFDQWYYFAQERKSYFLQYLDNYIPALE